MFDDTTAEDLYADPTKLQAAVLNEFQDRLDGNVVTTDPNNTFFFALEAMSSMTVGAVRKIDNHVGRIYKKRATTFSDLFSHISDFDYVGIFATPSSLTISLTFDKDFLLKNAVQDDGENYKKVIIPSNSVFKIENMVFGIYYPIEIRLNSSTGTCTVVYNTDTENPLHELTTNTIEKYEFSNAGINLVSFIIPVYQFEKTRHEFTLTPESGFKETIAFTDNFYAARVYHYLDKKWVELNQTISEKVYDPSTATIKLIPQTDLGTIKVEIPQVYFNEDLMGKKLRVEVFTTEGVMDLDLSGTTSDSIAAAFIVETEDNTEYTSLLERISYMNIALVDKYLSGGTDGRTFDETKQSIIYNANTRNVLVSATDLMQYFADRNMYAERVIENLTKRLYTVYSLIQNSSNMIIPVVNTSTILKLDEIDNCSTIHNNLTESVTILPSTIYDFDINENTCTPINDVNRAALLSLSNTMLAEELNTNNYTKTPYYTWVSMSTQYPSAISYDLSRPSVDNIKFVKENSSLSGQMLSYVVRVTHIEGTGYKLDLYVNKSDDLKEVPEEALKVLLTFKSAGDGGYRYAEAEYIETVGSGYLYSVTLTTEYDINPDSIRFNNFSASSDDTAVVDYVNFSTEFIVSYLINSSYVNVALSTSPAEVPSKYNNYVFLVQQEVSLTLGISLEQVVYNNVDVIVSNQEYEKYPITEYYTYAEDVYEEDEDGVPVYTIDGGTDKPVFNILHNAGDTVVDGEGQPVVKHTEGDIVVVDGSPVVSKDREFIYYIDMFHFDYRLFRSEASSDKTFVTKLTTRLNEYFELLDKTRDYLLEETDISYSPKNTMGTAAFRQGQTVKYQSLQLGMKFRFHVKSFVTSDQDIIDLIRTQTISIIDSNIQNSTMSMNDLANLIKETLSDYIDAVDVLGINGDTEFQTLIPVKETTQSSLGIVLTVKEDGTLALGRDLEIERVVSSD